MINVDSETGKVGLSMKLVSQGDGRDLDPSHAEAQSEGERSGGGKGGGKGGGGIDARREREAAAAAMAVPEYGGRPRLGGAEYEMVAEQGDDDEVAAATGASASGTYQLRLPNGDAAPAPPGGLDAKQRLQVELAAQLLAKGSSKKSKKEKSHKESKGHKSHKKSSSHKKDKHGSSSKHGKEDKHKKDKHKDKKRKRDD